MEKRLGEEEETEKIDFQNYKGMFYKDPPEKYQDEITGAHFEYHDMYRRLYDIGMQRLVEEESSIESNNKGFADFKDDLYGGAVNNKKEKMVKQLAVLLAKPDKKVSRNITQTLPQPGYGMGTKHSGVVEFPLINENQQYISQDFPAVMYKTDQKTYYKSNIRGEMHGTNKNIVRSKSTEKKEKILIQQNGVLDTMGAGNSLWIGPNKLHQHPRANTRLAIHEYGNR